MSTHAPAQASELDATDKALLDIIQTAFPLDPRPYRVLGEALGIAEEEALARVKSLKERRVIRRMGANFQSAKLGYRS
ncbi:MAG: Lrp/AsnC family transcriptional regulator, partial [Mailhella sp.]|nr:Lrp/AsnC family transcriptional regulator [Mailhella sp.]